MFFGYDVHILVSMGRLFRMLLGGISNTENIGVGHIPSKVEWATIASLLGTA